LPKPNLESREKRPLSTRASLNTIVWEWRKGREGVRRGKDHVTEDITKNLTRKIGHGYCETAA
jgi:hypothetical protein